jgi:nucleoside-diphosphate-sugar epimerase
MRVLVTGATGFLGCHTVAALLDAGHHVRVLVRSPETIRPALEPVGVEPDSVQTLVGDVTDPAAVEQAVAGCDAVVHAAAAVSLGPRGSKATYRDNVRGGEAVLGTACRLGLDPIVHVSGVPAMLPCRDGLLTPDSPPGNTPHGYLRSKVAVEEIARRLQADGVPVVIVQPGLMLGPHDPKLGMGTQLVRDALTGKMPIVPDAGLPINDVRDLAAAIARTVQRGRGPRRYMLGGTYITFADLVDSIAEVAGRRIPRRVVNARLALAVARIADVVQRAVPAELPITAASAWVAIHDPHTDDSRARDELGFVPRDLQITLADTIGSLVASGRLSPQHAARPHHPRTVAHG